MSTHNYPALRRDTNRTSPYPVPVGREGEQACAHEDPEKFFPDAGHGDASHLNELRAICGSCPFLAPCLDYAMDRPALWGVWGGTSMVERAAIRRNTRRAS